MYITPQEGRENLPVEMSCEYQKQRVELVEQFLEC